MGISTSLVLIAAGAILKWAVSASTSGINLNTVGRFARPRRDSRA
jgi:hypothetical protein